MTAIYATTNKQASPAEAYFSRADPASREKAQTEPTDGCLAESLNSQVAQKVLYTSITPMCMHILRILLVPAHAWAEREMMASDSIRSPKSDRRHVQFTCNDVIFIMEIATKEGMGMALQRAARMLSCKASCRDPQFSSNIGTSCIWPCMMIS